MAKITLGDTVAGYNLQIINNNFDAIEAELQSKVLYRDNPAGEPNQMENALDMNGNRIQNLPAPVSPSEAARLQDVNDAVAGVNTAVLTSFDPYLTITSTNVQGAIAELKDEKDTLQTQVNNLTFSTETYTRAELASSVIDVSVTAIQVTGYAADGDGGDGLYVKVGVQPTHEGKVQSADGAWWELKEANPRVKQFGAVGSNVVNDKAAIDRALTYKNKINLDRGNFFLGSTVNIVNTSIAEEPGDGTNYGTSLVGQGERYSVLRGNGAYNILQATYGLGVAAHAEQEFADFSVKGVGTSTGFRIENAAFLRVNRLGLYNNNYGLFGMSVLSSAFRDVRAAWGNYGAYFHKGTGFSNPNALLFENCNFQNNTNHGMVVQNPSNMQFIGGSIEGNGTQANAATGGVHITFDGGSEGSVGATFIGTYFEGNGGGYDLKLENLGSTFVTVTLIGCNFNRVSSTKFVTNNIIASGRIKLNLINCTFKGFNSYAANAGRPYINYGNEVQFQATGCRYESNVEAPLGVSDGIFAGFHGAGGASPTLPGAWTIANPTAGVVQINHNLNTMNYSVVATSNSDLNRHVQRVVRGANNFQIVTVDVAGALLDAPATWQLVRLSGD